jgi:hypothetical protein
MFAVRSIASLAIGVMVVAGFPNLANASSNQVQSEFWVETLTLTNPVIRDSIGVTGDDAGFVALSGNVLLNTGNGASAGALTPSNTIDTTFVAGFDLSSSFSTVTPLLGENTVPDGLNDREGSFLFTNLETQTAHIFTYTEVGSNQVKDVNLTGFRTVGPNGTITADPEVRLRNATLTADVSIRATNIWPNSCVLLGSGYGRVGLWDGCQGIVWDINLANGAVTESTGQRLFTDFPNEVIKLTEASNEWRGSGILEYRNGVLSFLQTGTTLTDNERVRTGIYRFTPSTGAQQLILGFPTPISGTGVDLYNFVYSTQTDQWCGHQEGSTGRNLIAEMDGMQEPIFCFSATSSLTPLPPGGGSGGSSAQESVRPAIHLDLQAKIGDASGGSKVLIEGQGLKPGSSYSLVLGPSASIVQSGLASNGGRFSQFVSLPSGLAPGTYTITLTAIGADGSTLTLVTTFVVSSAGTFTSISPGVGQGVGGLAVTGSSAQALQLGLAFSLTLLVLGLTAMVSSRRRSAQIP